MDNPANLHPYMAFAGDPTEGAILVFATDRREALKLGWRGIRGFLADDYTSLRVRRLREEEPYVMTLWDGVHQIVDDPPTCPVCETWGRPLNANGNGIALAFARTDTRMFQHHVFRGASAVLFLGGRPHFHKADGQRAPGNSGGPICLIAYEQANIRSLLTSGLPGALMFTGATLPLAEAC